MPTWIRATCVGLVAAVVFAFQGCALEIDFVVPNGGDRSPPVTVDVANLVPVGLGVGDAVAFFEFENSSLLQGPYATNPIEVGVARGEGEGVARAGVGGGSVSDGDASGRVKSGAGRGGVSSGKGGGNVESGDGRGSVNAGKGIANVESGDGRGSVNAGKGSANVESGDGRGSVNAGTARGGVSSGGGRGDVNAGDGRGDVSAGRGKGGVNSGDGRGDVHAGSGKGNVESGDGRGAVSAGKRTGIVVSGVGGGSVKMPILLRAKKAGPEEVVAGDPFEMEIELQNTSRSNMERLVVFDALDPRLEVVDAGGGMIRKRADGGVTLVWDLRGTLEPDETNTVVFVVRAR